MMPAKEENRAMPAWWDRFIGLEQVAVKAEMLSQPVESAWDRNVLGRIHLLKMTLHYRRERLGLCRQTLTYKMKAIAGNYNNLRIKYIECVNDADKLFRECCYEAATVAVSRASEYETSLNEFQSEYYKEALALDEARRSEELRKREKNLAALQAKYLGPECSY